MTIVLDASVIAASILPDEHHAEAVEAMRMATVATVHAPILLWSEIRNSILMAERRKRIEPGDADELLAAIGALPIAFDRDADERAAVALTRRHALTFYDALYLELARRLSLPLATLDKRLCAAAQAEGIQLAIAPA